MKSRLTLHVVRLLFAAAGRPCSKCYFMDRLLLTGACSDASDAEIIMITCNLPMLSQ